MVHGKVFLSVYLVRHPESKENVLPHQWTPEEDLATLTGEGRNQGDERGNVLNKKGIAAISSFHASRSCPNRPTVNPRVLTNR